MSASPSYELPNRVVVRPVKVERNGLLAGKRAHRRTNALLIYSDYRQ